LVDVLITHGPPRGIGDQASPRHGTEHLGCDDLARQVEISQPFIHVFGHIHGGHSRTIHKNTVHYNASICDEAYRPVNKPWIVELA
jgi:Icc-related predicted phosphoesterase